jgi:DNA-binding NarL/FixJ family response regulator
MIRVLICDDQEVVREGLRAILSTAPNLEVVGVADNGEEAVEAASRLRPDVVLMDLKMPVLNGIHATRLIHEKLPEVRVLVLTTYDLDDWVFDAIQAGAAGYLLKDTPRENLIAAIQGTADGKTFVDPAVAGKLFQQVGRQAPQASREVANLLTERELAVLKLLAHGLSNPEIAQQLFLSEGTVRNYVSAILTKLQVTDRTQAALLALRSGITTRD